MKIIIRLFVLSVVTIFIGCATAGGGGGSSAGGSSAAGLSDADLKRMGVSETYEKRN